MWLAADNIDQLVTAFRLREQPRKYHGGRVHGDGVGSATEIILFVHGDAKEAATSNIAVNFLKSFNRSIRRKTRGLRLYGLWA